MEIYQWLFKNNGFSVSDIGYFVFANASKNRDSFDGKLEFEMTIIEYKGDISWIDPTILEIKKCLDSDSIPASSPNCKYCEYNKIVGLASLKYKPKHTKAAHV